MQPSRAHLSPNSHAFSMPWPRADRAAWWTCVPSRACPVRTVFTSAAGSPWAIARARARSCAGVERGMADCSSHCSTAVCVVSHFRPTFRPGRSPRCRRSYTVSAETVSNCAVRGTSRTSGQRPAAGAAGCVTVWAEHPPGLGQGNNRGKSLTAMTALCSSKRVCFS